MIVNQPDGNLQRVATFCRDGQSYGAVERLGSRSAKIPTGRLRFSLVRILKH